MDEIKVNNLDPESFTQTTVLAYRCHCNRCKYVWYVFSEVPPSTCARPECRSPYWNKLRTRALSAKRTMKRKGGRTSKIKEVKEVNVSEHAGKEYRENRNS
jgi:hypothetical protein